jgi:hypothetical protein
MRRLCGAKAGAYAVARLSAPQQPQEPEHPGDNGADQQHAAAAVTHFGPPRWLLGVPANGRGQGLSVKTDEPPTIKSSFLQPLFDRAPSSRCIRFHHIEDPYYRLKPGHWSLDVLAPCRPLTLATGILSR